MKILLVTSHFYPENFKANDMAFELQRRGHEVTVMTPIPDYPKGKYFDGYGIFQKRKETINGVKIIRTFVTPRRNGTAVWLGLNYLTYTLFASIRALFHALRHKYDSILVHETSPVMVGIPAIIVKKIQHVPMHFWVLDLWPESLQAAGGINSKSILEIFRKLTSRIYRNSDTILISSKGFRKSINTMGDFDARIKFFPNWIDDALTDKSNNEYKIPVMPKGFNVVFAGNIGDAQDIPNVLKAAELLKDTNINFVLVGDGRRRQWAEEYVREHNLTNVVLPGRFPLESMPKLFSTANILFLSLKDSPIFALTCPAKLQAYMSSGKPIVAMINGEGAATIQDAECGWSVPAEHPETLAALLREIAAKPAEELATKGANGQAFANKHYKLSSCIDNLEATIAID